MKFVQWIALSAALTCLPFAACAQGKPAHRDALLYFVWPQNGTTIKGGFWCRFGLRNMGVTHAGDKHTLQLALGDAEHYPHNPPVVSQKITITVR